MGQRPKWGPEPESVVYFISDGTFVKIGVAVDVKIRMRDIQACCPQELSLIGVFAGGHKQERAFHREFAKYRIRNEWFRMEGKLFEFLDELYLNPPMPPPMSAKMMSANLSGGRHANS